VEEAPRVPIQKPWINSHETTLDNNQLSKMEQLKVQGLQ